MRTAPPNEAARPRAQAKATLTSERARRALLLGVWDPSTGTVRILPTFPRDIPGRGSCRGGRCGEQEKR